MGLEGFIERGGSEIAFLLRELGAPAAEGMAPEEMLRALHGGIGALIERPADADPTDGFRAWLFSAGLTKATVKKRVSGARKALAALGRDDLDALALGTPGDAASAWFGALPGWERDEAVQALSCWRRMLEDSAHADVPFLFEVAGARSPSLAVAAEAVGGRRAHGRQPQVVLASLPFSAFLGSQRRDPAVAGALAELAKAAKSAGPSLEAAVVRVEWSVGRAVGDAAAYVIAVAEALPGFEVRQAVVYNQPCVPMGGCELFLVAARSFAGDIRPVVSGPARPDAATLLGLPAGSVPPVLPRILEGYAHDPSGLRIGEGGRALTAPELARVVGMDGRAGVPADAADALRVLAGCVPAATAVRALRGAVRAIDLDRVLYGAQQAAE